MVTRTRSRKALPDSPEDRVLLSEETEKEVKQALKELEEGKKYSLEQIETMLGLKEEVLAEITKRSRSSG